MSKQSILHYILLSVLGAAILFESCKKQDCKQSSFYFGGKLSNPKTKYLLFGKDNKILDTLHLNQNNQFGKHFFDLEQGMYVIKYENFIKYVYFDNNDSINFLANAQDFHNLSTFDGKGSEKNNFLLEMFALTFENNNFYSVIFQKTHKDFVKSVDSLKSIKTKLYTKRKNEINWNQDFDQYVQALIDYVYFTRLEAYSFIRKRYKHLAQDPLPENYFNFREKVQFNEEKFSNFQPFTHYLSMLLTSISYEKNIVNPLEKGLLRLQIVDSLIENQKVKDKILSDLSFMYMLEDQDIARNKAFFKQYLALAKDPTMIDEVKKMNQSIVAFERNAQLKDFEFRDIDGQLKSLTSQLEKTTLLIFWSSNMKGHLKIITDKVTELKKRYPNLDLIAINVDSDPKVLQKNKSIFHPEIKYLQTKDFNELRTDWVILKLNRAILVNANGTIAKGFVNLSQETIKLD